MTTSHQPFIQAALDLAYQNIEAGGRPFGSVVVRNQEIVGQAANEAHLCADPTAHAEYLAIKRAASALETSDLSDCVVYASGQPCPLCVATMGLYGIKQAYYAYTVEQWRAVALPPQLDPVQSTPLNIEGETSLYSTWLDRQAKK